MSADTSASGYPEWTFSGEAENHHYLVPAVLRSLPPEKGLRLLDIGCGNGALSARLAQAGMKVTGIDFTLSGIDRARGSFPDLEFAAHDITEPLPPELRGRFDVVVSAEVIEHLFLPRGLFACAHEALAPGGTLIVTTPYHGYWKNLAIALRAVSTPTGWCSATTGTSSSSPRRPSRRWPPSAASSRCAGSGPAGSRPSPPPWS